MATIAENLRATLLSLKQISDRVKSLVTTSVTKSEATADKNEILSAIGSIPSPDLSNVAPKASVQNDTTNHTTIGMLEDGNYGLNKLARQGINPNTSLTAVDGKIDNFYDTFDADIALQLSQIIGSDSDSGDTSQSEQQVSNLRTLQQSYNSIATSVGTLTALDSDIAAGKQALATAITAKGVTTSPTQSMSVMAQNISSITQKTIEIDGGDMYAEQLFGSLTAPNYWNLYEVMAYLLTKTSSEQYSILLCEFPKGGEQYVFGTAVSAGSIPVGYVFSDDWQINGEGSINIHANTESGHVWNDDLDMKGNRWVAWLFAQVVEGAMAPMVSLGAAATNCPQPRSIHIGRHMGTIIATANGVLSEIVVTDTDGGQSANVIDKYDAGACAQTWRKDVVFKNNKELGNTFSIRSSNPMPNIQNVYLEAQKVSSHIIQSNNYGYVFSPCGLIVKAKEWGNGAIFSSVVMGNMTFLQIDGVEVGTIRLAPGIPNEPNISYIKQLLITNCDCSGIYFDIIQSKSLNENCFVYVGHGTNTNSFTFSGANGWSKLKNLEIENGWCKSLNVSYLKALTEPNMYAHILQRLKQDEPDCGDGVTITLGSTNLAKLTSEESVQLLDDLTNIYGYTFA